MLREDSARHCKTDGSFTGASFSWLERLPVTQEVGCSSPVRSTNPESVTVAPKTMAGEVQHDDDQRQHTDHGVEDLDS